MTDFGSKYARTVLRTPEEFRNFLAMRPAPSWGKKLSIHHTWSPTETQWRGLTSLDGVFRYYRDVRGWPPGVGPHFFGGPDYPSKRWVLFVATDPVYKGIGVAGRNSDSWHLEHTWNGDKHPFSAEVLEFSAWVVRELSLWAGLPIQWCDPHVSSSTGLYFHRDRRDAGKSCPGTKVTHEAVMAAYKEDDMTPDEVRAIVREEIEQVWDTAAGDAAEAHLMQRGILTKKHPGGKAASIRYMNITLSRVLKLLGK